MTSLPMPSPGMTAIRKVFMPNSRFREADDSKEAR
jgi:hypothetical protein